MKNQMPESDSFKGWCFFDDFSPEADLEREYDEELRKLRSKMPEGVSICCCVRKKSEAEFEGAITGKSFEGQFHTEGNESDPYKLLKVMTDNIWNQIRTWREKSSDKKLDASFDWSTQEFKDNDEHNKFCNSDRCPFQKS